MRLGGGLVSPAVQDVPLGREPIVRPRPLDVDERALPLAEQQVLQGAEGDEIVVGHEVEG